ncbi:MAG: 3-deoxy-D-manno-octulosonic acid transferase [Herminiimonas sp.]|nr:3-deoxy-D-manno-octulosonic acid transferase [Herminiimonas sp.]
MRRLYSFAWWIALPLILLRLYWRGRKEPGYRHHLAERLGFYGATPPAAPNHKTIWIHAVSVGETRAAEPLVTSLLEQCPGSTILLTHMTPAGRATGASLFGDQPRVMQCYLPYDTGWMTARFLRHFAPRVCVLMETEVWPNMMAQCAAQSVPVALVNARLSELSLRKALRLGTLMQDAARAIAVVAAQTPADAARLRQTGVENVQVTGSIKFDIVPPSAAVTQGRALREAIGSRAVLLCASTRDGEEALILDALKAAPLHGVLLVIVPRHPQRFDDVARAIEAHGLRTMRRSQLQNTVLPDVEVLLGDSMGEMFAWYAACDVAFIGGSLLPLGGQNLIEACASGKPVLAGPHTFNFATITEDAIAAGAARRVRDAGDMLAQAAQLLQDEPMRREMGAAALRFATQHRGATERTVKLLAPLL